MYKYLALVVIFAHGIHGQVPFLGTCPEVSGVQQNFDVDKYLGTWIAVEKYFTIFEAGKKCVEAVYFLNETGTMQLRNQMTWWISKSAFYMHGYGVPAGDGTDGKLIIHFTSPVAFQGSYWIMGTDYESYAVVWSCTQVLPALNIQLAWVLTRDRDYSQEALDKAHAIFDDNNLSRTILYQIDQTDCPAYDYE